MNPDRIEVGDVVYVGLNADESCCLVNATVLVVPFCEEPWILKTKDGAIIYVKNYWSMSLIKKG